MVVGGGVCEDGAKLKVKQTRRRQWDGRPTPRLLEVSLFRRRLVKQRREAIHRIVYFLLIFLVCFWVAIRGCKGGTRLVLGVLQTCRLTRLQYVNIVQLSW